MASCVNSEVPIFIIALWSCEQVCFRPLVNSMRRKLLKICSWKVSYECSFTIFDSFTFLRMNDTKEEFGDRFHSQLIRSHLAVVAEVTGLRKLLKFNYQLDPCWTLFFQVKNKSICSYVPTLEVEVPTVDSRLVFHSLEYHHATLTEFQNIFHPNKHKVNSITFIVFFSPPEREERRKKKVVWILDIKGILRLPTVAGSLSRSLKGQNPHKDQTPAAFL